GQLMVIAEGDQKVRSAGIKEILTNQHLVRILIIGIGMAVIQQLTGINVILYYGQTVLTSSGFEGNAALIAQIGPGIIGVLGAVIALRMMDRFDRRKTFLTGLALTTVSHIMISVGSGLDLGAAKPYVMLTLIIIFVGSMQTFLNVAVWVYISEI